MRRRFLYEGWGLYGGDFLRPNKTPGPSIIPCWPAVQERGGRVEGPWTMMAEELCAPCRGVPPVCPQRMMSTEIAGHGIHRTCPLLKREKVA
jgi:hypothetical protein